MEAGKTERGFSRIKFTDRYGVPCSVQESSLAIFEDDEPGSACIWFGADEIGLKEFVANRKPTAWEDVPLAKEVTHHFVANNRMHLTQNMVRELLPALQYFADNGHLPDSLSPPPVV